jgi:two-component system cell cycle response regulator
MFAILTAGSGAESLHLAQTNTPDLVVLDLMMPGMDSFVVCAQQRADPRTAERRS